jgi:hypothetical protein
MNGIGEVQFPVTKNPEVQQYVDQGSRPVPVCYCPCCGLHAVQQLGKMDYRCGDCGVRFTIVSRAPILSSGTLEIDRAARKVRMRGEEVSVTAIEFRVLEFLMSHSGIICSRDSLVSAVWGHSITEHSVNVIILRLRKKIEPDRWKPLFILTHRGLGYSFHGDVT